MKVLKKIETDMWINVIMMFLIGVLFIVNVINLTRIQILCLNSFFLPVTKFF